MSSDSIIEWSEFENMACMLDDFDFEDDTPPSNFSLSSLLVYDPSPTSTDFSLRNICCNLKIGDLDQSQRMNVIKELLNTSENLEEDLFNLLGIEQFDSISTLIQHRETLLKEEHRPQPLAASSVKYPNVFTRSKQTGFLTDFGTKFALPVGTTRANMPEYEALTVPANFSSSIFDIPLVNISAFHPQSQKAFPGYKTLNKMQSAVFQMAYTTNENLLICAPTGSGKTDIATMAVLKAIQDHFVWDEKKKCNMLNKSSFKVVYIAPMKALVNEIVQKFTKKLSTFGIIVREYSGDMNLTRKEIETCNMIVSTPEKWDVVTRKGSTNDTLLTSKVCLLIIDEVHLLNDQRGPVIESIVTRTHRQVEISQRMLRIVGLSATLPNYIDVAMFLGVNPERGMFYFDDSFRPVPLQQSLVGVKGRKRVQEEEQMNNYVFTVLQENWYKQYQVLLFVHSRNDTVKCAKTIIQNLQDNNQHNLFFDSFQIDRSSTERERFQNHQINDLLRFGIGVHHAGLSRHDRNLVEKMFLDKNIGLLCCTATLAWGVNLPAHTVIIKGTNVYDSARGGYTDLSILDVLQIFGRAGRPQFERFGEAHLITTHDRLYHYVNLLLSQMPIESQFKALLADNMNAEIVLGNIASLSEAISWLRYSYLYIRMRKNPSVYGVTPQQCQQDPALLGELEKLSLIALKSLKRIGMIGFDENSAIIRSKELGRIASNFYLKIETIEQIVSLVKANMSEESILDFICNIHEFTASIKIRDIEFAELKLLEENYSRLTSKCIKWEVPIKINILVQTLISQGKINSFSLEVDSNYIAQNFVRIARATFQYCLLKGFANSSRSCLNIILSFERRLWWHLSHVLLQFPGLLKEETLRYVAHVDIFQLREMSFDELYAQSKTKPNAKALFKSINSFPLPDANVTIQPITETVIRVNVEIWADFQWNVELLGQMQNYWISVFDYAGISNEDYSLHNEFITLSPAQTTTPLNISFTIPIKEPIPNQIYIEIFSDSFFGCEISIPVSYQHLILPQMKPYHTDLLRLQPLSVRALHNPAIESIYSFEYFNPIQTQLFHCLYHGQTNVLLGSPTGSGKTVSSELAIWNSLRTAPNGKIVYISPLKALVKERLKDWSSKFASLGLRIVELSGDVTPDLCLLNKADIFICTPEKWDGISREWKKRKYLQNISLVIIDEIHLLGTQRGPVLECIVSRLRLVSQTLNQSIRIVGLSTALANACDLADWLGITEQSHYNGLFNFRPSVRPVPLTVFIEGFPGIHYCPRMESMNKPCFNAILTHSPQKPVIIFVSSRRQTKRTAEGLISYVVNTADSKRFLHVDEVFIGSLPIKDQFLRNSLLFGIGIHHAGLTESDRLTVEQLFLEQKIQILVATSTLAWGVNFPAYLVIVKGTEYFDTKSKCYIDYPITDLLQMMGRAGRPQFDDSGKAVILTAECKKEFYKKFLYEPFPVESNLPEFLADFLNAEIASGNAENLTDCLRLMKWTFYYRRIQANPTYYGLESDTTDSIDSFLETLIRKALEELIQSETIEIVRSPSSYDVGTKEVESLNTTVFGKIASFYYVSHKTIRMMVNSISNESCIPSPLQLLQILSTSSEYDLIPLRHNEDVELKEFCSQHEFLSSQALAFNLDFEHPTTKAFILLLCHLEQIPLPISDFVTDTTSILEQSVRLIQAMIDITVELNNVIALFNMILLLQRLKQGISLKEGTNELSFLPFSSTELVALKNVSIVNLLQDRKRVLGRLKIQNYSTVCDILNQIPLIQFSINPTIEKVTLNERQFSYCLKGTIDRKTNKSNSHHSYCPLFPKQSEEVVFVILVSNNNILLFKRFMFGRTRNSISFSIPISLSTTIDEPIVYLEIDSYPKYSYQYKIHF